MPESVLRCPGCGAPATADAVRCEYCTAPLATVTCASCFGPMFVGNNFCIHCGAKAAGERTDDTREGKCPRCSTLMERLQLGAIVLRTCRDCGGLWCDPDTLQQLVDSREAHSAVVSAIAASGPSFATAPDVVRYVPCPLCSKLMNRRNFASSSGVVLDVCKEHGVWLDRGELQRVIAFVEGGGLTLSRRREMERLAQEQQRLRAMQAAPQGMLSTMQHDSTYKSGRLSTGTFDAADVIGGILAEAMGLVRRIK